MKVKVEILDPYLLHIPPCLVSWIGTVSIAVLRIAITEMKAWPPSTICGCKTKLQDNNSKELKLALMTPLMSFDINMQQLKHQLKNFVDKVPTMKEYWQQWELNWLNSSSAQMKGTLALKVHQEAIEVKDNMMQALELIGGVLQDLQVNTVQATTTLLQELRAMGLTMTLPQEFRTMGHNMTKLQDLRTTLRVAMTQFQGFRNKDPSIMILRQELLVMQDKKM